MTPPRSNDFGLATARPDFVSSSAARPWRRHEAEEIRTLSARDHGDRVPDLALDGREHQTWEGFGVCFNELGSVALHALDESEREQVLGSVFDGGRFPLCRVPIGANDYALEWYSHHETDGDTAMDHFSISRDHLHILPYVRAAMRYEPAMRLFASPWSPPVWMKYPRACNHGTLRPEPTIRQAYALYLHHFVEAYRAQGIPVEQVHVQNEPDSDQKFPSCKWTGEEMRDFIRDHLGPLFREQPPGGRPCEIWAGTFERADFSRFGGVVVGDEKARAFVTGLGFQWAGREAVQRARACCPDLRIIQTENECGDGANTWDYATYVFDLAQHYLVNGVQGYCYWNMILPGPDGPSTWGWKQNSMLSVDLATGELTSNPEFYVMQLLARTAGPGWVRLGLEGRMSGYAVAFRSPDGREQSFAVRNPYDQPHELTIHIGSNLHVVTLDVGSVASLTLAV